MIKVGTNPLRGDLKADKEAVDSRSVYVGNVSYTRSLMLLSSWTTFGLNLFVLRLITALPPRSSKRTSNHAELLTELP